MFQPISRCFAVPALLGLASVTASAALGQVYQRADTTPIQPNGAPNPATILKAVAATDDGGYIAVGREGTTNIHIARYGALGNVIWSRFAPMNLAVEATGISRLNVPGARLYAVVGEVADASPWGTWSMIIDDAGNLLCSREFDGVGGAATGSRSPAAVKGLADGTYVVTGRAQLAAGAPGYGRLTRLTPGCGQVWSKLYMPNGLPGLTGGCEITDVVEEQGGATLLAVGTAFLGSGGSVPFLMRVTSATGVPVLSRFYGNGDPQLELHGDGLDAAINTANQVEGYIFDGRMTPVTGGAPGPMQNHVVKVDPAGLNVIWGENFPEFDPGHACVRSYPGGNVLAGTRLTPNGSMGILGAMVNQATGGPVWGWTYGQPNDYGFGVAITAASGASPVGPIIVGTGGTATAPSGYLVKSAVTSGSTGGCEHEILPPTQWVVSTGCQFEWIDVQHLREFTQLIPETLRTVDACPHPVCCNPDFNGDGNLGTDADIADFFACLGGTCCPTCGTADFNCDGNVGTDADIASFFRVLAGGPC